MPQPAATLADNLRRLGAARPFVSSSSFAPEVNARERLARLQERELPHSELLFQKLHVKRLLGLAYRPKLECSSKQIAGPQNSDNSLQPPSARSLAVNSPTGLEGQNVGDTQASQDQDVVFNRWQSLVQGPPAARAATHSVTVLHSACAATSSHLKPEATCQAGPETKTRAALAVRNVGEAFLRGFVMQVPLTSGGTELTRLNDGFWGPGAY